MTWAGVKTAAALGLVAGAVATARADRGAVGADESQPAAPAAGPRARSVPAGAVVAEDEKALAALLSDARGPGEVWLLPRAYRGDWVIRRRVALRGASGAELVGTGHGTVLSIEAADAQVENLTIRNSGHRHTQEDAGIKAKADRIQIRRVEVRDTLFGISLGPCRACVVEEARVSGARGDSELRGDGLKLWEASGSFVRDCQVEDSRDVVVWYSRNVVLERNRVTRSRYGSHFMYAHDSVVRDSRLEHNVVGIFVMYSTRVRVENNVLAGARGPAGVGIGFKESDSVTLRGNWLVANTTGVYLDRTPRSPETPVRFERNVLALNDVGMRFHSSERGVEFTGNDVHRNGVVLEVEGGGDALGVRFSGNYWSDYAGFDLGRDGTGDVPHEVKRLSSDLYEQRPALRLFDGSLAMGLVDAVARAVPVLSIEKLLVDDAPRMNRIGGSR
jgi:nitrous oxidase accessory protein